MALKHVHISLLRRRIMWLSNKPSIRKKTNFFLYAIHVLNITIMKNTVSDVDIGVLFDSVFFYCGIYRLC